MKAALQNKYPIHVNVHEIDGMYKAVWRFNLKEKDGSVSSSPSFHLAKSVHSYSEDQFLEMLNNSINTSIVEYNKLLKESMKPIKALEQKLTQHEAVKKQKEAEAKKEREAKAKILKGKTFINEIIDADKLDEAKLKKAIAKLRSYELSKEDQDWLNSLEQKHFNTLF